MVKNGVFQSWKSLRRLHKILLVSLLCFVVYVLVGFFVVPPVTRSVVESQLTKALNRPVTLEKVRFNPLTLHTQAEGLDIKEPSGDTTFVSLGMLDLDIAWLSVPKLALVVQTLRLVDPYARIVVDGEQSNFADLLVSDAPEEPKEASGPPPLVIHTIEIEGGSADIDDRVHGVENSLRKLHLFIPFVSSLEKDRQTFVRPELSGVLNNEPFRLDGNTRPFDPALTSRFVIDLTQVDLPYYRKYIPYTTPLELTRGKLDCRIAVDFEFSEETLPAIIVSGTANVKDLAWQEKGKDMVGLSSLDLQIDRLDLRRNVARIRKFGVDGPFVNLVRNADGTLNVQSWTPEQPAPVAKTKSDDSVKQKTKAQPKAEIDAQPEPKKEAPIAPEQKPEPQTSLSLTSSAFAAEAETAPAAAPENPQHSAKKAGPSKAGPSKAGPPAKARAKGVPASEAEKAKDVVTNSEVTAKSPSPAKSAGTAEEAPQENPVAPAETQGGAAEPEDSAEAQAFRVILNDFSVTNGQISFTDLAMGKFTKKISPLAIHVTDLDTKKGHLTPIKVNFGSPKGEYFELNASADVGELTHSGTVTLRGLNIPDYAPYLKAAVPLTISKGILGAQASWSGGTDPNSIRIKDAGVTLSDLLIKDPKGKTTLIQSKTLAAKGAKVSLKAQQASIAELLVQGLDARLTQTKQGIDLVNYFVPPAGKGKKSASASSSSSSSGLPWKATLGVLQLKDCAVKFRDAALMRPTDVALSKISGTVKGISAAMDAPLDFSIRATAMRGGSIEAAGQGTVSPLKFAGNAQIKNLSLAALTGYLHENVDMDVAGGRLFVTGDWSFTQTDKTNATFTGAATLSRLRLRDGQTRERFASLGKLDVRDVDFRLLPLRVDISKIEIKDPNVKIEREKDGRINLARMAGKPAPPASDRLNVKELAPDVDLKDELHVYKTAPGQDALEAEFAAERRARQKKTERPAQSTGAVLKAPAQTDELDSAAVEVPTGSMPPVTINEIVLSGGEIAFEDKTISPSYATALHEAEGNITGFSTVAEAPAEIVVNARLGVGAPLNVSGSITPFGSEFKTKLNIKVQGAEMPPVSPYTLETIAYPFATGKLTADIDVELTGPNIKIENNMLFTNLDVGSRVDNPDAISLPMQLILSLLRGPSGDIDLNIPVSGRLDDPHFSLGRTFLKTLFNLLFKVVTSPLTVLGSMFGGGEAANVVAFDPGSSFLNPTAITKLSALAKAMTAKQSMKLELAGYADPKIDKASLGNATIREAVRHEKYLELQEQGKAPASELEVKVNEDEYPKFLRIAYEKAPFAKPGFLGIDSEQPVEKMEELFKEHANRPGALNELAFRRGEAVLRYLRVEGKIDPGRLFMKKPAAIDKAPVKNGTGNVVVLDTN
ncbi:DUF748 domain-containing protein [Desulfobaculum bizertense]|uniref:DUF748 domain-containing protein n=1 Tax=Desulfobaculum bizertense TaxID=376490 RepID=UPI000999C603|nr:DUF748 domain-containing protein [Desulfobaculum bizertense]